jgi:MSHA pilin protein MshD
MRARNRGFTLVELVILIAIIAAALAGVLLVFQNVVRGSADPQIRKQALAIAEAMLDEALLASYNPQGGGGTRANFDDIGDYAGFSTVPAGLGMTDIQGNPIPGLAAYNVTVAVEGPGLTPLTSAGLPAVGESRRVTVTVTVTGHPEMTVMLDGYRLNYAGP